MLLVLKDLLDLMLLVDHCEEMQLVVSDLGLSHLTGLWIRGVVVYVVHYPASKMTPRELQILSTTRKGQQCLKTGATLSLRIAD